MRGSVDRVGDWLMGKTLGSGHYGKVKLGIHAVTGEKVGFVGRQLVLKSNEH